MQDGLLSGALSLGVVSWVCGLVSARASARHDSPISPPVIPLPYWIFALFAPLIFWLISLPDAPPFGMGHASGNGVLLGGWAATIGVFAFQKAVRWEKESSRAAGLAMLFSLASSVSILVPLMWKQGRFDVFMGVGIGWLASLFLLSLAFASPLLLKAAAFGIVACANLGLATFRDSMMTGATKTMWSDVMAILIVSVPFVLSLCALPAEFLGRSLPFPRLMPRSLKNVVSEEQTDSHRAYGWQIVLAAILLLIVAQLLATKVSDQPALVFCVACGAVAGFIAWLVCSHSDDNETPFAATLVLLAAFIVAYRLMQGYGAGAMILGAWLPAIAEQNQQNVDESPNENKENYRFNSYFTFLLSFSAVAMLYRFAATRFQLEIATLELDEYFSFFALMAGAVLPSFLARLQQNKSEQSPAEAGLRALICGGVLLAVPLASVLLWGGQSVLVLTAGAGLGLLLVPLQGNRISAAFFALGGAVAVAQWTKHALPLYELTRADKAKYLGVSTVVLAVFLLLIDIIGRRKAR